jgi:anaerobic selenocysteine-containing dehydrogenase
MSAVASKLMEDKSGIAAIASTRLSAETLTAFKELFVEKFQSKLVTSIEEGVPTEAVTRFAQKNEAFEGKLDVLRNADTVMCIGANIHRSHMVAGFMFKRNLSKGTRLITVDPETSDLDYMANIALKTQPGSDLALIRGLQAVIVNENLGRAPLSLPDAGQLIEKAVSAAGISLEELKQTAELLARSISPVILFGKGITAQRDETLIEELHRLAVLVGAVDSERHGLISIKGETNSLTATLLGLDTAFDLNGQKVVYAAVGDDYVSRSLVERVSKAPYLVVQASYESKLTEEADIILPVTIWAEQEGHYINLDGRVQASHKAITPPETVRENIAVLNEIAMRTNMTIKSDWQKAILARKSSVALN